MKVKFLLAVCIWAIFFSVAHAEGIWRLDGTINNKLPRNFRAIEDLKISGSGQPSESEILILKRELQKHSSGNIYIIDLREESHGFANGYPVSYYVEKNLANYFKRREEIESIEFEQLTDMLDRKINLLPLGNEDKKLYKPINISVKNVETERQLTNKIGIEYVRFSTSDMYFPTPEVVDEFIIFVANLNENDWLHFHCQAGHGRTTTFMVMYEIMKHPEKSLEEICSSQAKLPGGSELLERKLGNDYYTEAHNLRAENLIKFFQYIRGVQNEEIGLQWSEYLELNK